MTGLNGELAELNGIKFRATGWFLLHDRGTGRHGVVLTANLYGGEYTRDQLSTLVGMQIVKGVPIRGVESFAVDNQTDKAIGLLI